MGSATNCSVPSLTPFRDIISERTLQIFTYIDFITVYTLISSSGIVANILNIVVFARMDLKDTVNISLLGLAFSDLCYLVLTFLMSISYLPVWNAENVGFNVADIRFLVIGWPHFYFKRVSNWITAYLMFERCLCIAVPLKVHEIITPKRTSVVILTIVFVMAVAIVPVYVSSGYQIQFDKKVNRSSLRLVFNDQRKLMSSIATGTSSILTVLTFVWFITCTCIMVSSLKESSKWRGNTPGANLSDTKFHRDRKVIKMVTLLSVIFIVAFLPEGANLLVQTFDSRVTFGGQYNNLLLILLGISETFLSINASLNIVIYWNMSSKYREIFRSSFCKLDKGK